MFIIRVTRDRFNIELDTVTRDVAISCVDDMIRVGAMISVAYIGDIRYDNAGNNTDNDNQYKIGHCHLYNRVNII